MGLYFSYYQKSEKRKIVEAVAFLCHLLDRPICSGDLKDHFIANPSQYPLLTQRFGQLLLKASRPSKHGMPRLYPCGLWNYHQYYAPDSDHSWTHKFKTFALREKLKKESSLNFFDRTRYLLGGPFDTDVRNSMAGWILEFSPLVQLVPNDLNSKILQAQISSAQPFASIHYVFQIHLNLISRSQALHLLSECIAQRCPHRVGFKVNLNRYLADLRWPQSSLFAATVSLQYRFPQLQAFIRASWPVDDENPDEASALRWLLRF